MSRFAWHFGGERVENCGNHDGKIGEVKPFGREAGRDGRVCRMVGKKDLPMGSTWRLISWETFWLTPAAPYKMAKQ